MRVKSALKCAATSFLGGCLLVSFALKTGMYWQRPRQTATWGELFQTFPSILLMGLLFSILATVVYTATKAAKAKAVLCPNCKEVRGGRPGEPCDCGRSLEDLDDWQWAEDDNAQSEDGDS